MESIPHPAVDKPQVAADRELTNERVRRMRVTLEEYMNPTIAAKRLPARTIMTEKPIHTAIAYMLAAGRTRKEVAAATGVSESGISDLLAQPWFCKRLKEIADAGGRDMVKSFFECEVIPSLEVLREIRDNPQAKDAARIAAVNSLLNRGLGLPVAYVESKTTLNIHTAAAAADQVQSELEKIDRELSDRGVKISQGN
jgi:hypothetical protein